MYTVRRYVTEKADDLCEGMSLDEDQKNTLLVRMIDAARKLVKQFHWEAPEKIREIIDYSLQVNMPMEDLSVSQKEKITKAIGDVGSQVMDDIREEMEHEARLGAPTSIKQGNSSVTVQPGVIQTTPSTSRLLPIFEDNLPQSASMSTSPASLPHVLHGHGENRAASVVNQEPAGATLDEPQAETRPFFEPSRS